jgi:2-methylcitrate dehydratase PrpD
MSEDATGRLASYAVGLDAQALPEVVQADARTILADTLGVLCSASTHTAVRTAVSVMPLEDGPCTVVGHGRGARPEVAAFVNGIGGHDIELDDSHSPSRTHPSAVIVPSALAAAEAAPDSTIGDLIAGIVAAYEVQSRVSKAIGRHEQYARGFHPSAVCGAIGGAVAAGRILGLSVAEMRSCLGLAAGQASGLLSYHDDPSHMAKSFQTGVAARNGVTAALFARHGYRAAPDVLTGRHDLLKPFGGDAADPSRLAEDLGSAYETSQTSIKRHACCGLTHSAVDAVLLLMAEAGLTFDRIEQIDVELPNGSATVVDGNVLWTHNIQYVLALAAHEGRVGLEHFGDEWTTNEDIAALAKRITVAGSDELQRRFPEFKSAIVTIRTNSGEFARQCDAPRGSPGYPLTATEIEDKFLHLAAPVLDPSSATRLWDLVTGAALAEPAAPVFDVLSSAAPLPAGR